VGDAVTLQLVGAGANNSATMKAVNIVYVNGTLTENGTGTESNPYNNIASAMANADAKLILINGTTALTSGTYSGKTIQCGSTATSSVDTMFTYALTGEDATFDGMTIVGLAPGAYAATTKVFNIDAGNLVLDGGTVISGCAIAADLNAGSCTVKDAQIFASQYSVKVENSAAHLNLNSTTNTKLSGTVYLGSGASFYVSSAITNPVVIECASPAAGMVIATGSSYTITSSDAAKVGYINSDYSVALRRGALILTS
jgi:hypothetical protein